MRISTRGRYALQLLLDIGYQSKGSPVTLRESALRQKLSVPYLEQIARKLRIGGLLRSIHGPGGGYVLARRLDEVSLLDVFKSVGEVTSLVSKSQDHSGMAGAVGHGLVALESHVLSYLSTTAVQEFVKGDIYA